ncbi:hypothetical protein GGS24DRAFT_407169 [Hypoxylon argillaceum]|nr:hypothetical protein GGS24DRAFT_407169 [Hypoxylon argillaceum]
MGILYFRRDEGAKPPSIRSDSQSSQDSGENGTSHIDPVLVLIVVIATLIVTTLAVVMTAYYLKSRRAQQKGFQPVEKMGDPYSHKRKISSGSRQEVEDLERDMMIRKSLASRVSLTTSPPTSLSQTSSSPDSPDRDHPLELSSEAPEEQRETTGLRDDWKAWEARITSERRISHPGGLDHQQHPALAPYLSMPQPTLIPPSGRDMIIPRRI